MCDGFLSYKERNMPIKEKILRELRKGPVKFKKLQSKFKASRKFFAAMNELYNEGLIDEINGAVVIKEKKKKVKAPDGELFRGTVVKLTENFGFVKLENEPGDIFVSGRLMMGALPGDEVSVKKIPSNRRDIEGEIVRITREKQSLAAAISYEYGRMYATLLDCPYVKMRVENRPYAQNEDIVIVSVKGRGTSHRNLTCTVTSVIGKISSSKKATDVLIASKEVETAFPKKVIEEARRVISNTDFAAEAQKRENFTDIDIFTIDSRSTKDIDDAIHIKKTENGYELGVHIADVSFYVRGGTECDSDAYRRGTSIYYGDTVIPMLPVEFSNDVCSLNENRERLAFSCIMRLDGEGNLTDYRFTKSLIRSRVKGVYSEINSILAGDVTDELKEKYRLVWDEIFTADELFGLLRRKRNERGYLNIESDEAYIVFDKNGTAVDVKKRVSGESEQIIEEFMILANSCAAKFAKKHELPFIYRIHEEPSEEKMSALSDNLLRMNIPFNCSDKDSIRFEMSRILDDTRDTPLETTVHRMILRSQSKAKYSDQKIGHFSLALNDYSHFTSPIRRYSDLAIHRIMSDYLAGKNIDRIKKRYDKYVVSRSKQASEREIIATRIERDADEIYKAEIMSRHIGESFIGTVTSVTSFGIYVMLDNTAEGLVHVSRLDMIQPTLNEGYSLYCKYTGREYTVGDKIAVKVTNADILNGNIDMVTDADNPVHIKVSKTTVAKKTEPQTETPTKSRKKGGKAERQKSDRRIKYKRK